MPTWLTQIGHWIQPVFTTLRGLSITSIVLLLVAGLVVVRFTPTPVGTTPTRHRKNTP